MALQVDFGRNQILRPEFLNTLQDILASYIDIFLLTYSGARVIAEASVTDPVAVTIEGRMRQSQSTLEDTISGPAGTYDVFFTLRTVTGLGLEAVLGGVPTGGDLISFRHVGQAVWNGATITGVTTDVTMQNGDYLAGRSSHQTPEPYAIPISLDSGQLHPGWFPEIEAKEEPIGTVQRRWVPAATYFNVPTGWAPMDGRTLTPSQHAFSGVGTIVLPDMRNKTPLGANLARPHGAAATPSNLATSGPGLGAVGGSNTPVSLTHSHTVSGHTHTMPGHTHFIATHNHTLNNHNHQLYNNDQLHVAAGVWEARHGGFPNTNALVNDADRQLDDTSFNDSLAITPGAVTTSQEGGGTSSNELVSEDRRPAHVGLAFFLKVL